MSFEYIRAIEPSPAPTPSAPAPILRLVEPASDETDLVELVAHALERTSEESLACPPPPQHCLDLPRFSGITLADVPLLQPLPASPTEPVPPASASAPPASSMLLGSGMMPIMIAVVATLAVGVFVVTH